MPGTTRTADGDGVTGAGAPLGRGPLRRRGYTLLEVLVAAGLLIFLGGGLVALLSQAIRLWNRAESRALVHERARAVLDLLAEDLRSTVVRTSAGDVDPDVRFVCDRDARGRQRLRFVRTTTAETADPLLRQAGQKLAVRGAAAYDGVDDRREAEAGRLAAPGGRLEVIWALDPREGRRQLWRGYRAPVGGPGSLLRDRNVEATRGLAAGIGSGLGSGPAGTVLRGGAGGRPGSGPEDSGGATEDAAAAVGPLGRRARSVADGVLFLGFAFWGPTTTTWAPTAPPLAEPDPDAESGPLFTWDSTRALLDRDAPPGQFAFRRRPGSLVDPTDDIFPGMVEITLVLREGEDELLGPRLAGELGQRELLFETTQPIRLPGAPRGRFVLVEDEWIAVRSVTDTTVRVHADGRGVRDTRPAEHPAGARVTTGVTFRRVVDIPGGRRLPETAMPEASPGVLRGRRSR